MGLVFGENYNRFENNPGPTPSRERSHHRNDTANWAWKSIPGQYGDSPPRASTVLMASESRLDGARPRRGNRSELSFKVAVPSRSPVSYTELQSH
jgi:hypothetical protein